MKELNATILASVLFLGLLPTPIHSASTPMGDCSCTATDNSCSASITCRGGCETWCGVEGDCYAQCSGFLEILSTETTFQTRNATYPQLVAELAHISGRDVSFAPAKPDTVFNAEYKKALLWDVFEMLSGRGTVQIAGQDFERLKRLRRTLLSGTKISLCVRNAPVNTFVNDLASVTGLSYHVVDGRPMATVNVKLQDVSLSEIVVKVSEQTGTKIVEVGVDTSSP